MTNNTRHFLLILSSILFIALTPILVFHLWGYRWNMKEKKIIQTGALILQSTPSNADIYLNAKLQKKQSLPMIESLKNFIGFNGIAPGECEILLSKNGYYSWTKKLKIEPGLITKAENIVLLPENPRAINLISRKTQNFIFSPDKKTAVYKISGIENNGIWTVNLENKTETQIVFNNNINFESAQNYFDLKWDYSSQKFLFAAANKNKKELFIADIKKPNKLISLSGIISPNIKFKNIEWHPHNNNKFFYLKNGDLWEINYLDKTLNNLNIKNVLGWTVGKNAIYWIQEPTGIFYKSNLDGKNKKQMTINHLPDISEKTIEKIIVSDEEKFAIMYSSGELYFINGENMPILIGEKISGAEFSNNSEKLLFYSENEIFVLWIKNKEAIPKRKKGEKELITRSNKKITQTLWHSDFEHIFFTSGNKIKFIELDNRDKRNVIDFIETNTENQNFFLNQENKKLYFTDEKNEMKFLYEVNLTK